MKKNEFMAQSYKDALKDYEYSLENPSSSHWDYVFITASNEGQAASYEKQIERRKAKGRLPERTKFVVLPDLDGERIGSGGATLNILRYLYEECGAESMLNNKILVLHSGGDSKRMPQYSAVGKLFSPIPRQLESKDAITIFDDLLIMCSGIPNRIGHGMFIMSGDTAMVFNPLQLDLKSADAAGVSIKTGVLEGTQHGVFLSDESRVITEFLHKQSEDVLRTKGAVDSNDNIDIDTGTIWFSKQVCQALFSLIAPDKKLDESLFRTYINSNVCLSLYADFLPPLAANTTLDGYRAETPENTISEELLKCRDNIWNALRGFTMEVIRMVPAEYLHFGTTWEMYRMFTKGIEKYDFLDWKKNLFTNATSLNAAVYSSYVSDEAQVDDKCWIEYSDVESGTKIGSGAIVSGVTLKGVTVPEGVVLHGFKLVNGKYICRIYGVSDNPKNYAGNDFLGHSLRAFMKNAGVSEEDLWEDEVPSIWNAKIYPECNTMEEAVDAALTIKAIMDGNADAAAVDLWKKSTRYSLKSSFNVADVSWILDNQEALLEKIKVACFIDAITNKVPVDEALEVFDEVTDKIAFDLENKAKEASFPLNMRIYYSLYRYSSLHKVKVGDKTSHEWEDLAYEIVKDAIVGETLTRFPFPSDAKFAFDEMEVKMPVRVNFCGSPSDAAPYCLEHGGTMFDGTLLLKGDYPIVITAKRLAEPVITFGSEDLKGETTFTDIHDIQACYNTDDTFALHKAVLIAMGLIPEKDDSRSLAEICQSLGGGLYLSTAVDVPKGSGLGTSSIIAVGCIKAIDKILGIEPEEDAVYAQVFAAEQLMSTGGGWQDQVGGYDYGLKYFTAQPGTYQQIKVERPEISKETFDELSERFCLIFSGQRRLAKNVLREEMNKCIGDRDNTLKSVDEIRQLCALMKFYLEKGDVTSFAGCITKQFDIIKTIDKGSSNTCIEYIFDVCDDLIDGKAICGAGGGGFLQVVLKKGVKKSQLVERIEQEFADCGVKVWDCTLI